MHSFREGQSSVEFGAHLPYRICFESTDGEQKEVLMDLWSDAEGSLKSLAAKDEFYEVHSVLAKANGRIRKIAQLEKFQEKRQESHSEIIMENELTIKHYGLLKVVAIFLAAVVQLLIIRSLLTGKQGSNYGYV